MLRKRFIEHATINWNIRHLENQLHVVDATHFYNTSYNKSCCLTVMLTALHQPDGLSSQIQEFDAAQYSFCQSVCLSDVITECFSNAHLLDCP